MRTIEKARPSDLSELLGIYNIARDFMRKNGNQNQWGSGYPGEKLLLRDLSEGNLYVLKAGGIPSAAFVLAIGKEPNYEKIDNGAWLSDTEYGTIHRVASNGRLTGVFADILTFCEHIISHLRIDTHRDNLIMQKLIERNGFTKCGIIYIREDGTPRIAYEKV